MIWWITCGARILGAHPYDALFVIILATVQKNHKIEIRSRSFSFGCCNMYPFNRIEAVMFSVLADLFGLCDLAVTEDARFFHPLMGAVGNTQFWCYR